MSAPLVINLKDGSVWERRAVTAAGVALYALAGSCACPEFVMATESELAAQGIAGTADVLPVPVGPEPQPLSEERLAEIEARAAEATPGPWCTDSWEIYQGAEYEPGLSMWIGETCRGTSSPEQDQADAAFVAAARSDVPALAAEVRRLLAERHETNESLTEAAEALRVQRDREAIVAEFVAKRAEYITSIRNCHPDNGHDYDRWQGHAAARRQLAELLGLPVAWPPEDSAAVARSAEKLARLMAPTEGEPVEAGEGS